MMIPSEPKNVAIWNADQRIDFPLPAGFVPFLLYTCAFASQNKGYRLHFQFLHFVDRAP